MITPTWRQFSTVPLRLLRLQAKDPNPSPGMEFGLLHRFPSAEWAAAYQNALNNNPSYRDAGKCWTFGSVAMVVLAEPSMGLPRDVGVVLDVHGGQCRAARFVEDIDSSSAAEFALVGSYARWQEIIEAKLDPMKGLMEGKLKLACGDLATVVRFVEAARQLVVSASKVPTSFL
jgi:putative sterol carrier protein